jgi:hypothetical protein
MGIKTRTNAALALALALLSAPVPAAPAAPGFCVEDRDDALWIDCEHDRYGLTGREIVRCRRAPGEPLIEVAPIARELDPGSGDCPAPRARGGPGKDWIPRNGEDETGCVAPGNGDGGAKPADTATADNPAPPAESAHPLPLPETAHGR